MSAFSDRDRCGDADWCSLTSTRRFGNYPMIRTAKIGTRKVFLPGLLAVCAMALVTAGCSDPQPPVAEDPTAETTTAKPVDFDPCTDIPQSVLKSEGLALTGPEDWERDGTKAHGCGYIVTENGYDVRIVRTTRTLADIKAKFADSYREEQFGSRTGAFYGLFAHRGAESCVVNLAMKTGSLQFDLANPATGVNGDTDSCVLVTNLVNKVLPSIPKDA
ncbi:DUF3558 family protein [Nocardia salmonicida]|uniref:DUF3558 family protein n=1 Tax=Nocardia salmonicida TaxID=53431 RepID=UPI0033E44BA4